ncbi:MAG TPA: NAD(P)-dependent alcohol dehydrogenase [Terracidiphilus sp.]|nr:NAD(P)-dependent alcohol dehydrogenase [Terracidiphilus sp.]
MHVWQIASFGIDSLEFAERPDPEAGPGQVVVRVHAISFNYRDLMMVKGIYNPKLKLPRIPCSDGAGEVVAVGPGVTLWKRGDRVAATFMQNWVDGPPSPEKVRGALGGDIDGMLAEYVVLNETGLVAIPDHLSYQEAATLPCAAVTAWNALSACDLKPGNTVLIQGTGGVSIFALQFARLRGAKVLGISGSDEKLRRAYDLGLDAGVNYNQTPEWDRWALEQSAEGVDLIVEVGGLGTMPRSLRALRMGGTIAQVGVLTGPAPAEALPLPAILHKQARIRGIYVGSRQDFIDMNSAIALTQLRPVGEDFPWTHARQVLGRLEEASHFGKLVMTVG